MDIVPAEVLGDTVDRRHIDRDLCALQLDGYLRRLARQEALCRRVLGRIARSFLAGRAHHRLGFARLGDYTRERLGLSAREVQELARVAERLESLPAIAEAFARGELSWTHARLLATAATPDSEQEWLALARGRTVRGLEALLAPPDDGEESPRVRFALRCPRRVRAGWRAAVELARRMAGAELTLAQAAEAIAAEGLSAVPAPTEEPRHCAAAPADAAEPHPDAGWSAPDVAAPDEIAALAYGGQYGDPFALDERMRVARRAMQRIDWQMGVLLRLVFDLRLHRAFGFPSAACYVVERLGLSARKARALVALERGARRSPALAAAYREGDISWLRALTILPVATDDAWVGRARAVTLRRLVAEVEWALDLRDAGFAAAPPPPGAILVPPERQMRAHEDTVVDADINFTGPAAVVALFRGAAAAFCAPRESLWRGCEKLLDHARHEWEAQPRHRDPIFARDGWRCAVPACTSRGHLHDHHLVFRSQGGDNTRDNRVTVCVWHHLRGIHLGRLRACGTAPDDITWEIGLRRGRPPLLRTLGDRYLP